MDIDVFMAADLGSSPGQDNENTNSDPLSSEATTVYMLDQNNNLDSIETGYVSEQKMKSKRHKHGGTYLLTNKSSPSKPSLTSVVT